MKELDKLPPYDLLKEPNIFHDSKVSLPTFLVLIMRRMTRIMVKFQIGFDLNMR